MKLLHINLFSGRRGLLLPQYLSDAVAVVLLALQFEEIRGHTPTGQHVRDAACFVCWAFARAYSDDLVPYINDLLIGLMVTALFDREVYILFLVKLFKDFYLQINFITFDLFYLD